MGFFDEFKSAFKEEMGIPDDMSIGEGLKQEFLKNIKGEEEDGDEDDDFDDEDNDLDDEEEDDEDDDQEDGEETDATFCPNCGKPIEAGSRFCPKCGTPVAEEEEEEPDDDPADVGEFLTIAFSKLASLNEEMNKIDWSELCVIGFSSEADLRATVTFLTLSGGYGQNVMATSEMMAVAIATEDSKCQAVAALSIRRYYDRFSRDASAAQLAKVIDDIRDNGGELVDAIWSLMDEALAVFIKFDGYIAWFTETEKQFVPDDY